ncbi:5'-nucleotidase C-terminal domain-containing protein [Pseudalkalibacillus berkeleyi]|uniref:5'-nucleotidase C-terminal domain-containing protein n=1 Tax=Pseudalkalibacillus berkeleyi TaxID=1069813 RepID=A0ABS9H4N3_9BACL|nr:5'-nucleotidase C-terminal domain-containing protein [Pseudalkalibacillus berkeleyi]MCF6138858.1 5'-nucleotidase C-terminal domain-containing protein [Pseudalkalibacillus berkeleyi]
MKHHLLKKWTTLLVLVAMLAALLPTGMAQAATTSITDAKTMTGQNVTVEGIVTADFTSSNLSAYIQDDTAGINVFSFNENLVDLQEGQRIQVTGEIKSYKGLTEIVPGTVEILSSGNDIPAAQKVDLATLYNGDAEPLEGSLVQVNGYVQSVPTSNAGSGYNISFIDDSLQGTTIRVENATGIDVSTIQEGKWYDVTAIVGQYNDYQLLPRTVEDFKLSEEQPPAPQPKESYEATIDRVVDGDTVHIQDPIIGSTKIRMLSIDTPETNYNDQSQGAHAEAATEELKRLLPAGTKVTVELGDEPQDAYGRLLAHIHKGEMDVNKEMVRLGRAVPYFIHPNLEHFEAYSTATKEAIENGSGMWDPNNPIEELPYEFRFNLRGGPDKFVGDYFTKEYVTPDKWEDIPVENRVFFFEEQAAIDAGYTKAGSGSGELIKVQLLGLNDLHGKIDVTKKDGDVSYGRINYLATYLKEREATNPNTLTVHAGDMVGASSPVSALLQDEPTVELMEAVGFDVGAAGNHEFDEGVDELLRLVNGGEHPNGLDNYDGMDYPLLAANVEYKETGELLLDPYKIFEIGGTKVGFIGIVTDNAPSMVIPEGIKDIRFTDEAEAVNKYVPELQSQGVEAIVVLAHEPVDVEGDDATGEAADLANNINDAVDVIVAGHNHVKVNAVVDNKLIVQSWEYGMAFSDIDLEIDPVTNDVVSKTAEIVDVVQNGVTPDAEVTAMLDEYLEIVGPKLNEVVGEAAIALEGGYAEKGLVGDNALGNLIAEGMRTEMDADFALMNGGGIRDDLDAGEITWGELYNIQPFGNTLVKIELTGDDLRNVLNTQFHPTYGPDLSIGGFRYTWNEETNEVVSLYLPDGSEMDPGATYTVVVNSYMYPHGTDRYRLDELGENPVQGPIDLDGTINYIERFAEPIEMYPDARISSDYVAPMTNVTQSGEADVVFTIESSDGEGVGLLKTEYRLNGGEWTIVEGNTLTFSEDDYDDQVHQLDIRSIDQNFNKEAFQTFYFGEEESEEEKLEELHEMVDEGMAEGKFKNKGIAKSLHAKIDKIQDLEKAKKKEKKLKKLKTWIKKKSKKHIDKEFAEELIEEIDEILENY